MPPTNSPLDSPPLQTTSRHLPPFFEQLEAIASPVADLAATLTDPSSEPLLRVAEEGPGAPADPRDLSSTGRQGSGRMDDPATLGRRRRADWRASTPAENRRRFRRDVLQNVAEARREGPSSEGGAAYQGWAPGTTAADPTDGQISLPELGSLARGYYGQEDGRPADLRRFTSPTRRRRREEEEPRPTTSRGHPSDDWMRDASLRTTALLQSVRRQARFSPHSRQQMENYILERGSQSRISEDTGRPQTGPSRSSVRYPINPPTANSDDPSSVDDIRARIHYFQQAEHLSDQQTAEHVHAPETHSSTSSPCIEEVIRFLARLPTCNTYHEQLATSADSGYVRERCLSPTSSEDFILDIHTLKPPPPSSWLQPFGVFSGMQRAEQPSMFSYTHNSSSRRDRHQHHHPASGPGPLPPDLAPYAPGSFTARHPSSARQSWYTQLINRPSPAHDPARQVDTWPVRVTINSIDYDSMTLSGTMEAFNVPNKNFPRPRSSQDQDTSITTFLEGEIIDFKKFSLETQSFPAGSRIDAEYWRKLGPLKDMSDAEILGSLCSRKWIEGVLREGWVLMRWKEKCFVTPTDAQAGLTISGFYYVAMRRSDGRIEGMYYDPNSSPHQQLFLMPEKRSFPAYEFT